MTVAELIEVLKTWPNQNAPVVFLYASETDGDTCVAEINTLSERAIVVEKWGARMPIPGDDTVTACELA